MADDFLTVGIQGGNLVTSKASLEQGLSELTLAPPRVETPTRNLADDPEWRASGSQCPRCFELFMAREVPTHHNSDGELCFGEGNPSLEDFMQALEKSNASVSQAQRAYEAYRRAMHAAYPEDYPRDFSPWVELDDEERTAWRYAISSASEQE